MARTLGLWTLLACLVATPALGQSNEVKRFLNAAITLYENLEYEKALKQLQKARAKASGPDDEMKIALLEGVVLADLGKEERALTAFKTAFGFDLEAKLPVEVSPKVGVIAEKARANVRKLLAPQLAREKEEKLAEEKKRAEVQAAQLAEQKRRDDEERLRSQPPPAVVSKSAVSSAGTGLKVGAGIAGGVGLLSGAAAVYFLVGANARYTALSQGTAAPSEAATVRESGKQYATLGYLFTGVAVAGIGTGVVLFVLSGRRAASAPPVAFLVTPTGGLVTFQGAF